MPLLSEVSFTVLRRYFLHTLHLVERPCNPCLNKNQECVEGQRKLCKYLLKDAIVTTTTTTTTSNAPPAALDIQNDEFGDAFLLKSEYKDLRDLVEIPDFYASDEPSFAPSLSSPGSFIDWRLTKQDLDRSIETIYSSSDIVPFNYDASNKILLTWLERQNFDKKELTEFLSLFEIYNVALLDTIRNLSCEDLVHCEKSFLRQVSEASYIMGLSGTPVALWRSSGELVAANREFGQILKIPLEILASGTLRIYELMSPESAFLYWKRYLCIANDLSAPQSFSLKIETSSLSFLLWLHVKRDPFDLPRIVMGHFLPLFSA
ncbi:Transcription factor [Mitosporidium daphniae]|uniref:Uncharacterized protein n=1 Tax=Mitosporidium daphniae TaxID=1485682 RepID=A0A098VVN3_9MICR|nr:uncharacterized protein DI09_11p250 [Mitosporidium daphniae]KGG52980.1 hypothetical protein DI09_11p250 [Mitosporidium daphniae]|eukprot:XP_013239407.1 uncharacterized protein DI09_11p250 [Mitosporidium daphniae]